ncbi:MAG: thioesterase family protein [Candidatus Omnitrophota bacterium]
MTKQSKSLNYMLSNNTQIRVRYEETDQMGVVYHSKYLVWFEVARTELFREIGYLYTDIERDLGLYLAVSEASLKYKRSSRYDELLTVECTLTHIGTTSLAFDYIIKRDIELIAEGQTKHVFVDKSGKPKRIPEDLLKELSK